jgi:hypothetical protein
MPSRICNNGDVLRLPYPLQGEKHMKPNRPNQSETPEVVPPVETIGDLTISPETDIPFGKPLQMGLYVYTIYESATEQGYQADIAAHQDFMHDQGNDTPAMLDDAQFTSVLDAFVPKELAARDQALWRAHFIAGWASIFLGLVAPGQDV